MRRGHPTPACTGSATSSSPRTTARCAPAPVRPPSPSCASWRSTLCASPDIAISLPACENTPERRYCHWPPWDSHDDFAEPLGTSSAHPPAARTPGSCWNSPDAAPLGTVAPHVRGERWTVPSHGTGGQCCVTGRGQLCLPLTPPNRRSRSTVKLTTRVRPSHLRDLVTGTPRAAADSPGLYRGYPLVRIIRRVSLTDHF